MPLRQGWRCRASRRAPSRRLRRRCTSSAGSINPQIVAENVDIFKKLYDENVDYELVPGEYHAVAETKLIAGQHVDMMYSEEDHLVRWWRAKWVRDIEDMPGVPAIKATMFDANVRDLSLPNGKLGGLPYYSGFNSFVFNAKHLEQAKLQPPTTWGEFLDQCRKLKKDGVSEFPYVSAWQRQWASLSWSLFSIWYSEGAKVFDAKNSPVFDDKFKQVLRNAPYPLLRRSGAAGHLHPRPGGRAELTPPASTPTWSCTNTTRRCFNDPKTSQIAGRREQRDHARRDAVDLHPGPRSI